MKNLTNYKPVYFVVHLILGILFQFNYKIWSYGFIPLIVLTLFLLTFLLLLRKLKVYFTIGSLITFIVIGILAVYIQNPKNYSNYYNYQNKKDSTVLLRVSKILKPTIHYDTYIAKVVQVDKKTTRGKVLIYVKKDSIKRKLQVDNQLLLKPKFNNLSGPLNPHQFNYKDYLAKQHIYSQISTNYNEFLILKSEVHTLTGFISKLRNDIKHSLAKHNFDKEELSIINALLLGQRKEISNDLLDSYAKAGVIHILAISGLHIGILLLILSSLLSPLKSLKHGIILKTMLLVIALWSFAIFTGLSASVVRAVTMFTFITIGNGFRKRVYIEHSLIASMLLMLLFKPLFLYDIGFQLSYIAVFSIIWIQPIIYNLWKPKYKPVHKIWQLITVSLAAQIGIAPVSCYYFHQFPGLFLLSNIVIILLLGTILVLGIICIVLAIMDILPTFIVLFYGGCIKLMNSFIKWISLQENFLFTNISMSFLMMMAFYSFIIFSLLYFTKRTPKYFTYILFSIILIQSVSFYEKTQRNIKQQFILFHKTKTSIIAKRTNKELSVFNKNRSFSRQKEKIINSFITGEGLTLKEEKNNPLIFHFKNETILLIDSLGVYNIENLKKPIIILQNSPKINLVRLIRRLEPKLIVTDGSNFKSYVKKWEQTCINEKTPFYYTGKNGAYIIE